MRLHRWLMVLWAALAVPGLLWWSESVAFVIALSLAALFLASWGASEAADDSKVIERIEALERQLEEK